MTARASASRKTTAAKKKASPKKVASKSATASKAKKAAPKKSAPKKSAKATTPKKPVPKTQPKKQLPRKPAPKQRPQSRKPVTQYPPGVYDVLLGPTGDLCFARILALSTKLPNVPGVLWRKNKEHWFTNAALTNLASTLAANSTIRVRYTETLADLEEVAAALANPALYVWQGIYAKELLVTTDWSQGTPSYVSPSFYYAQTGVAPEVTMRMVLEPSGTIGTQLTRITWLNVTNTLSSFFPGAQPGTVVTLPSGGWPPSVSPSYYYRAP
jgi:hypothetical protein